MRNSLLRTHHLTILLISLNIVILFCWTLSRWNYDDDRGAVETVSDELSYSESHMQQQWLERPPITLTMTVTEVQTTTSVYTSTIASPTLNVPPAIPGPAFCAACRPDDGLCKRYGDHNLSRSRAYEGSNARLRRVIAKAMAGMPVKIAVLGGSVTKGNGLLQNHVENWTARFLEAWKELFPSSETDLVNGAVPAIGTDYYSMCFEQHIDKDVDLVIVELAINDQRLESNAISYEWLLRGLLALQNDPAVLNLHTMALSFDEITMGGDLHTAVAEYYDTPVISLRNMLANHIFTHSGLEMHYFNLLDKSSGTPDLRHVNVNGHQAMADLLIAYIQRQICAVELEKVEPIRETFVVPTDGSIPGLDDLGGIPRLRLFQKYDRETVVGPVTPFCLSMRTTKHHLIPFDTKGWHEWTYRGRLDKPYLIADEPGSYAKFEVEVGVMQRVRITYLRSKTFGLGDVWCWLDDNRNDGKRIPGWWPHDKINIAVVATISNTALPGKHILTCEIIKETSNPEGGHEFRLIAVDAS